MAETTVDCYFCEKEIPAKGAVPADRYNQDDGGFICPDCLAKGSNKNCLEGIRCPDCGNQDRFKVQATTIFELIDDGTDGHYDVEYNEDSYFECYSCGKHGTVKDFMIVNQ